MQLWLARHAAPLIESGVCYGALDVAADARQTTDAAHRLAAELPLALHVHFSPLQRCAQLAQALHALRPDLRLQEDPRLREMDFGEWEGRRWDAIGRDALDAWTADFARYRPGTGESTEIFFARVASAWDDLYAAGTDAAWITHAGVIRAASLLAVGVRTIARADQWPQSAPPFGQWAVVRMPV